MGDLCRSVVRGYKSAVTTWARKQGVEFGWQARFHDHIIRSVDEHRRISVYIRNNVASWGEDSAYRSGNSLPILLKRIERFIEVVSDTTDEVLSQSKKLGTRFLIFTHSPLKAEELASGIFIVKGGYPVGRFHPLHKHAQYKVLHLELATSSSAMKYAGSEHIFSRHLYILLPRCRQR